MLLPENCETIKVAHVKEDGFITSQHGAEVPSPVFWAGLRWKALCCEVSDESICIICMVNIGLDIGNSPITSAYPSATDSNLAVKVFLDIINKIITSET